MVDFPDCLSTVLFLQGCAWRCPYCHNRSLQSGALGPNPLIAWSDVQDVLVDRAGMLDAVVFSGGEPTIHSGLLEAMREVRSYGYRIGLHTNGAHPSALRLLVRAGVLDWVGIDLKGPRWLYGALTGVETTAAPTWASVRILQEAGVAFEARCTVYRPLLNDEEVLRLAGEARQMGVRRLKLQPCRVRNSEGQFGASEDISSLQDRVDALLSGGRALHRSGCDAMAAIADARSAPCPRPIPVPFPVPAADETTLALNAIA